MTYYLLHGNQSSALRLARRTPRLTAVRELPHIAADDVVIRFGNQKGDDGGHWTVNRLEALAIAKSRAHMARVLAAAGVKAASAAGLAGGRAQYVRYYQVPVFDLRPLSCFRTEAKHIWLGRRIAEVVDSFTELTGEYDEQARRVSLLAVRAVHALGLEFALVSLAVNPYGRPVIVDVSPTPVLRGRVLELYAEACGEYIDAMERSRVGPPANFLLGTDLEFMLKGKHGKIVLASRFFSPKGVVGCDERSLGGDRSKRPLAELRPEPARTPEELCQNIEAAIQLANRRTPRPFPQWMAGSAPFDRFPIGGHIHFSGIPYTSRLIHLLDVYIGLPLMLIEDPVTAVRRRPRYGFLGDIRHKGYGGFEYRTPASFLVDPDIALGALSLAYLTALNQHALPYFPLHREESMQAFYRSDRDSLLPLVESVRAELRRLPQYARYRDAVEPIFTMIQNDEVWDEAIDVRTAWGIELKAARRGRTA